VPSHLIGLLLGTEEDWPRAFELFAERIGPVRVGGGTHELPLERIVNEPFSLRTKPRYALVIDRLAWWYHLPREWLKKVALMDDVYLLNNPFTFQSMEKHSAYCAMLRLGLKVPETWMVPHKLPPANERFPETAARYNAAFDLGEIGTAIGYPLYMKPFDGGQWVGVTRIGDESELRRRYDESGERLMHLQAAVENYDVFVRSLSIGPATMSMWYDPERPLHDRYQVRHEFLDARLGNEILTIAQLVNAFFRWELNSCEVIVRGGDAHPIDYANASPDLALTSLHYYFPWAIRELFAWTAFCAVTRRRMRVFQDHGRYVEIGDDPALSYEQKLERYRALTDDYFQTDAYRAFREESLPHLDESMVELVESSPFDELVVTTVQSTFPAHEHEQFVEHYRGLVRAWARDQHAVAGSLDA
jgi:hypothetical protein